MLSEKLKVMIVLVIFGVIVAIIEILWYILPLIASQFGGMSSVFGVLFILFLIVLGIHGVFVLMTLRFGWGHPKWYVKLYTIICSFWEFLCALLFYGSVMAQDEILLHVSIVLAFAPLIPIWYFCYKEYGNDTLRFFWYKEEWRK